MKVYTNKPSLVRTEILEEALKETENIVACPAVGITFVRKGKIRKLNRDFRGIDKPTDVLSFPMFETKRKGSLVKFEQERDPLSKELEIGDIVICLSVAKKQAKVFGHSKEREINFLALHGFLHLLGYDHMTKKDEKEMFSLAEKILDNAGLKRGENV